MEGLAIRLKELGDEALEAFIEVWLTGRVTTYERVDRLGAANDKGRDVVGFLTDDRYEGEWHLYQCKRRAPGRSLELGDALTELGKIFHYHVEGTYATLPSLYVFVCPRGITGTLRDVLDNPSRIGPTLLSNWDKHCLKKITGRGQVRLSPAIRGAIEGYDFRRVEHLVASAIVKDPMAGPALTRYFDVPPGHAPRGVAPSQVQVIEDVYLGQLRTVYDEQESVPSTCIDDIFAHPVHGDHLRDQRNRFFDARAFDEYHRDNTYVEALETFRGDVYSGVVDLHRRSHPSLLDRLDAVMLHASLLPAGFVGQTVRIPVKQGVCHDLVNKGDLRWAP